MEHTEHTARTHVFVATSGGVDSSVAVVLLQRAGYAVTGVFIKGWHPPELPCTWRDERRDAMRVCARLGIPFRTCDLSVEYKRAVADAMIDEYRAGRTPNPDVLCNQHVKFGAFLDWARARGADRIATGHYAQIRTESDGTHALLRGIDQNKDQTYFLWTLTQDVLASTLFPIGTYTKDHVRTLAASFGLPTAHKQDSQGVCFLGQVDMRTFLKRYLDVTPGDVLDTDGNVIGTHEGAVLYTLGQRHGFSTNTQIPQYVVSRDLSENTIVVADAPPRTKHADTRLVLARAHWIAGTPPAAGAYTAQIRHRQMPFSCTLAYDHGGYPYVLLDRGISLPAVGQSVVIYDGNACLGGGVVDTTA